MLTIYFKDKKTRDLEHRKIEDFVLGSWIHLEAPNADEISRLVDEAGLDEGMLADALDPYEVPRAEKEEGITYIYVRAPYRENGEVVTTPILLVYAQDFLVTVTQKHIPLWDRFFNTRISFETNDKAQLVFLIFSEINREYQRLLTAINKDVRRTTVNLENISNQDIVRFVRFERTLHDFSSALLPMKAVFASVLAKKFFALDEEKAELIEDISLSIGQLVELCYANIKTIVNVRNAYSTIMSNNLNQVIRKLTALTIILTVPTMIASFFGMNVTLPFGEEVQRFAFWGILGASLLITAALLRFYLRDSFK